MGRARRTPSQKGDAAAPAPFPVAAGQDMEPPAKTESPAAPRTGDGDRGRRVRLNPATGKPGG